MNYKETCRVLGISRATLDRVINIRPGVSDKRRAEILDKISILGFKPNSVGKALAMQKKMKFGIIIPTDLTSKENSLFPIVNDGMHSATQRLESQGVKFEFILMKSGSADELTLAIDRLINKHVTGICLYLDSKSIELLDAIQRAINLQIKFVFYRNYNGIGVKSSTGIQMSKPDQWYEIAMDNLKEGYIAGELMGNYVGRRGKVAVLSGLLKNEIHQIRTKAAVEKLKQDFPDIEVIGVLPNCYPKDGVVRIIHQLVRDNPDIKGIIASCGFNTIIIDELEKMGLADQVRTIFFDFTPLAEKYLHSGRINIIIGQDMYKIGYHSINALYNLSMNGSVENVETKLPVLVKLKEWF
jgi:LacI family transcriptional regulator